MSGRIGVTMRVEQPSRGDARRMSRVVTRFRVRHRREWIGEDGARHIAKWSDIWVNSAIGAAKYAVAGRRHYGIRHGVQALITSKPKVGERAAVMVREVYVDNRRVSGEELRVLLAGVNIDAAKRTRDTAVRLRRLDGALRNIGEPPRSMSGGGK